MFPHYPWSNSFPFHSFLLSQLLSHHFHCCSCFSPLIYLNHPPRENRSPPQSGTNCFVRFTNPEPNPDKRTLVRTAVLFVFARVTDCAVIKVFIVPPCCSCGCREGLKPHSTSKLSQMWSRGRMARNAVGTNGRSPNCY